MNRPDEWKPKVPDDLIGRAGMIARLAISRVERGADRLRYLLYGPPGTGKSAACRMIAAAMDTESVYVSHVSAAQLTAEIVRGWIDEGRHHQTNWTVRHIDECDQINPTVELLMLQMMDELPERNAVLCTSNLAMDQLTDRFQSRFQCVEIPRPMAGEVATFMARNWPGLGKAHANEIANKTNGDVRAALNDAAMQLDYMEMEMVK